MISGAAGLEKISLTTRNVSAPCRQQFLHTVEELVAAAFGDVEQRHARAAQIRPPRGERLGDARPLIEWAHVVHWTSFEIGSVFIPRHGPNTAE